MGNAGRKMLGKELKLRGNGKKWLKSVGKILRQFFVYSGANFELHVSQDFLHRLTSNASKGLSLNALGSL